MVTLHIIATIIEFVMIVCAIACLISCIIFSEKTHDQFKTTYKNKDKSLFKKFHSKNKK